VFGEGNIKKISVLNISDNNYKDLHTLQQQTTLPEAVSYVLNLRIAYNHIYEATILANKIFGIIIMFTLMYYFVSTVSHTYFTFVDSFTNFDELEKRMPSVEYNIANHVIWVVISVGKTVAISGSCHMVREESKILVNNLQKLQLRHPIRSDFLIVLQDFSTQVSQNDIHFTACGFFSVNLSFLYTFIASSVTYVIILIQFRLN
jgi:gustatory receptor